MTNSLKQSKRNKNVFVWNCFCVRKSDIGLLCILNGFQALAQTKADWNYFFTIFGCCFFYQGYLLYISTRVWVLRTPNAGQNRHFQHFCCKKPAKMLKMSISTSVWSAQHPNAGRNIQQVFQLSCTLRWEQLAAVSIFHTAPT